MQGKKQPLSLFEKSGCFLTGSESINFGASHPDTHEKHPLRKDQLLRKDFDRSFSNGRLFLLLKHTPVFLNDFLSIATDSIINKYG